MKAIKGMVLMLGFLALIPAVSAQETHDHGMHAAEAKPKPGKKFESDKPLRSHMGAIRNEIQGQMKAVHKKTMTAGAYEKMSANIDKSVKLIFKDCKLTPDADAALHSILAEVMTGSTAMATGADLDARLEGYLKVIQGIEQYARTFNDPTWKPIEH